MKKRINFFQNVERTDLCSLNRINDIKELKKHVGEVLIFGYAIDNKVICSWIGILRENNFNKYRDYSPICNAELWTENTFYIYRFGKFLNINSSDDHEDMSLEKPVASCNSQNFIAIPDAKLIAYYNLCVPILTSL